MEGAISRSCSLTTRERSRTALKLHFQLIPSAPGFFWGTPRDSQGGLEEIQGGVSVLASAGDERKEASLDYLAFFRDYSHRVYPSLVANGTSEMAIRKKIVLEVLEKGDISISVFLEKVSIEYSKDE